MISPKSFNISRETFFFAKEKKVCKSEDRVLYKLLLKELIYQREYSPLLGSKVELWRVANSMVKFACESKENTEAHLAEQSINTHNAV